MPWLKVDQSLSGHPKLKKAASILKISEREMAGSVLFLWLWAMDYAKDGDLSAYSVADIELAIGWNGKRGAFVNACVNCGYGNGTGFISKSDDGLRIHDWHDYAGDLIIAREKHAELMRQKRAAERAKRDSNVTITPKSHDGHVNTREEKRREEKKRAEQTRTEVTAAALVADFWHDNGFGLISPIILSDVDDYHFENGMAADLIVYACEIAAKGTPDQKKWTYVRGILERFRKSGFKTRRDAESHDRSKTTTKPDEPQVEVVEREETDEIRAARQRIKRGNDQ